MIGVHVGRYEGNLEESMVWAQTTGFKGMGVAQVFLWGPKNLKQNEYDAKALMATGVRIYVHSSYLTSFDKPWTVNEQLKAADEINSVGLVLHIPKRDASSVARSVQQFCEKKYRTPVVLEMSAFKPGPQSYESPEKLIALIGELTKLGLTHHQVGICIDTAHIAAGKADVRTAADARAYLAKLEPYAHWIRLLHFNGNAYNINVRAGDKHTTPNGPADYVWPPAEISWADSGAKVFVDWFRQHKKDIILEQDMTDKSTQALYKRIAD